MFDAAVRIKDTARTGHIDPASLPQGPDRFAAVEVETAQVSCGTKAGVANENHVKSHFASVHAESLRASRRPRE
jgi:hypothetical protein